MGTLESFIKIKLHTSCDDFDLEFKILFENLFQRENFRNALGKNKHIHTAGILKGSIRE